MAKLLVDGEWFGKWDRGFKTTHANGAVVEPFFVDSREQGKWEKSKAAYSRWQMLKAIAG